MAAGSSEDVGNVPTALESEMGAAGLSPEEYTEDQVFRRRGTYFCTRVWGDQTLLTPSTAAPKAARRPVGWA